MTPQLLDSANNSDYAAMKEINEKFDEVNIESDPQLDQYAEFKTKFFNTVYKRYKSKKREVCERIEQETAHLVSTPMIQSLEKNFSRMMSNAMEEASLDKYQHYSAYIYTKHLAKRDDSLYDRHENLSFFEKWR